MTVGVTGFLFEYCVFLYIATFNFRPVMTRYAACIEYDGSQFSGWQAQKHDVRTVQETLERALSKLADEQISIVTAGRTDSGVHASHQVIHFESNVERSLHAWLKGGNRFLDKDVRIVWVERVPDSFHARFSAISRSYRYVIYNHSVSPAVFRNHVTHIHTPLDFAAMYAGSKYLVGEHDFSSFRAAGCQAHSPIRTIQNLSLAQSGPWIWLDLTANAFLQHMVRNIAGSLVAVGVGKYQSDWIETVLQAKDRTKGDVTALASGLYLVGVAYAREFSLPSAERKLSFWSEGSAQTDLNSRL